MNNGTLEVVVPTESTKLKVGLVLEALVDAALAEEKLQVRPAGANLAKRARALESHYRRTVRHELLIDCGTCGATSSKELPACPFCGDEDDEEEVPLEVGDVAPGPSVELVPAAEAGFIQKSQSALDRASTRILALLNSSAKNYWSIGRELYQVNKDETWKQRLDEGGKLAYSNFEQYARAELHISGTQAWAMMKVSIEYSEELVATCGVSKLAVVLRAPPDARDELLAEVTRGIAPKELADRVKEEREKRGVELQKTPGAKPGGKSTGRPVKDPAKLTVALMNKKQRVKLFARPKSRLPPGHLPEKRAKTLGDRGIGFIEVSPGTFWYFTLVKESAGLAIDVETKKRGDD